MTTLDPKPSDRDLMPACSTDTFGQFSISSIGPFIRINSFPAVSNVPCSHCGLIHSYVGPCHRIKAIEYHEDSITICRVEYLTPSDYPQTPVAKTTPLESDDDFRKRIIMTIGSGSVNLAQAQVAIGTALDELGAMYDLKRIGT